MTKFTFIAEDGEDGSEKVTVEFETDVWLDAFPKFLNLMKASGFYIDDKVALFSPTASEHLFGDLDYMLFKSDLLEYADVNGRVNLENTKVSDDSNSW